MANKSKRKHASKSRPEKELEEDESLDRFAGSSDEEDDVDDDVEEQMAPPAIPVAYDEHHDADVENDSDEESEEDEQDGGMPGGKDDDESIDSNNSIEQAEVDPASKMANAMGRILGGFRKAKDDSKEHGTATTSVVLGKTVTPLQRLQQKEKEKLKTIKEKRQAKKELNLSALHYPLSIATSNSIQTDGRLSVAKELEQERFHRRVATRGVVALFNAISQHQRSSIEQHDAAPSTTTAKKQEISKMTKHSFLDKIKSTAKSTGVGQSGEDKKRKLKITEGDEGNKVDKKSSWNALKDDYLLNPKKNWDEESSDEEGLQTEITEESTRENVQPELPRKKQRVGRH